MSCSFETFSAIVAAVVLRQAKDTAVAAMVQVVDKPLRVRKAAFRNEEFYQRHLRRVQANVLIFGNKFFECEHLALDVFFLQETLHELGFDGVERGIDLDEIVPDNTDAGVPCAKILPIIFLNTLLAQLEPANDTYVSCDDVAVIKTSVPFVIDSSAGLTHFVFDVERSTISAEFPFFYQWNLAIRAGRDSHHELGFTFRTNHISSLCLGAFVAE
jgi:hypothetical protein